MEAGASHVIVTSYVFKDGEIRLDRLKELEKAVGRKHLVLDVSCRRKGDAYYIVTDRWADILRMYVLQKRRWRSLQRTAMNFWYMEWM